MRFNGAIAFTATLSGTLEAHLVRLIPQICPMPHFLPAMPDPSAVRPSAELSPALGTDSTLRDLPLHQAQLDLSALGAEAANLFNRSPALPGVLLTDGDGCIGVLSRYHFLDYLLRPKGCELFLTEPLSVFYSYARLSPLKLPANTTILVAARAALRRPIDLHGEPIWVQGETGDRLLSSHDLNVAHWQIRGIETQVRYERAQAAMLQNQKMVALGRLVDGVAHEILDPLGFIWGNLSHVSRYCQQLLQLVATYEQVWPPVPEPEALIEVKEDIELSYLREDLPDALSSIQGGAERLKQLATSLQNFCHIDEVYPKPADLHDLVDSIVLLLKSRLTSKIQVVREYTALPPVNCFAGQLSQVFMNIVTHCVDTLLDQGVRAAAAFPLADWSEAAIAPAPSPTILIKTELLSADVDDHALGDRWVSITIADNGPGLSPEEQQRIVNSFSVRQRLARETDLATSYRIITAKHGGKFWVRSRSGSPTADATASGTEFIIHLPLYHAANAGA